MRIVLTVVIVLMVRKTVKTWTLSDGTVIPPDVYVGLAAEEMNKAEVCHTFVTL